ncbi:caspase family protein [Alistipes indistinctus]|uniref:caspase family protein n=1 Tax=Alistipes indistinctus TaxID=626932 RepID=UPI0036F32CC1
MIFHSFCSIFVNMGYLSYVKSALLLALLIITAPAVVGQTNRALIVAIDKYPSGSGWAEVHATNDMELVKPMLMAKGFADQDIVSLVNEEATKAGIIVELRRLTANCQSGDHIYIHFSCHGQQMIDDDGDEPDGLDEAIIPYDARRRLDAGVYEGENHLRDDELGVHLDAIRRKAGSAGNVVLVVDACHSGTVDRDTDEDVYVRGTAYIFATPGYIPSANVGKNVVYEMKIEPGMSPLTIIAACLPDQLNYEYREPNEKKYYGSLTYSLCGLMKECGTMSYGALRDGLKNRLNELNARRNRTQTPLIETSDEKQEFRIER